MKSTFAKPAILIASLTICLAASVGAFRRDRVKTVAKVTSTAADVLAAIPRGSGHSPTDQVIGTWVARLKQDARNADAWVNLGDSLMQRARETMDVAYYNHAESAFLKALELDPNNSSAMTSMAWVTGRRHKLDESIEWARKAIELDPNNASAYGLLGEAAIDKGDYSAAFQHVQKMLDLRPDLASYSRGAHLMFLTGDTRKAIWLMQRAIAGGAPHAENTAWCRAQLALMYWHTGALLPAEQMLETGLKETPNNYHLLTAMAKVKASQKQYDAAIDYYQRALAIATELEAVVALGDLYAVTGKKDDAEKQFARVESIHRSKVDSGVLDDGALAQFFADHDRNLPEALKMAEEAYKSYPNVFVADTLAWCYYKNGRYADAEKTIKKALSRRTPDASFLFHAGMIYAKLGDRVTAQKRLYEALSLNPNFHPVYAQIAADTLQNLGSAQSK